jgi:hypothetical protein
LICSTAGIMLSMGNAWNSKPFMLFLVLRGILYRTRFYALPVTNGFCLRKSVLLGKFTSAIIGSLCDDKYFVSLLTCICELCLKVRYYGAVLGQAAVSSCAHMLEHILFFDSVAFHIFSFLVPPKAEWHCFVLDNTVPLPSLHICVCSMHHESCHKIVLSWNQVIIKPKSV